MSQPNLMEKKHKRIVIAAVAVLIVLALIVGVVVVSTSMTRSSEGRVVKVDGAATLRTSPAPSSASPVASPSTTPKIKVGVYLSHFTANGPNWTGKGWGYNAQVRILREMKTPEFELYALIEPGSEKEPDLLAKLIAHFKTRPKLNVAGMAVLPALPQLPRQGPDRRLLDRRLRRHAGRAPGGDRRKIRRACNHLGGAARTTVSGTDALVMSPRCRPRPAAPNGGHFA